MVWLRACSEYALAKRAVTVVIKIRINLDKRWKVYRYLIRCW
jgi:hypothetical protein